jgi:hypothetical protein
MFARICTDTLFGYFNVGRVRKVIHDTNKPLQGFSTAMGPSLRLTMEHYFQVVAKVVVLKHVGKLFICRSSERTI